MRSKKPRNQATWSDVKTKLADFDQAGLIGLIQDLYTVSRDNQAFLHARFALGGDVLKPYKVTIARWLWPEAFKEQDTSVTKAKQAISDYTKAVGHAEGLAELMVFYCEKTAGFSNDVGLQDESYFDALIRMFARGAGNGELAINREPGLIHGAASSGTQDQPQFRVRSWGRHG